MATTQEIRARVQALNEIRERGLSKMMVWDKIQPLCEDYDLLETFLDKVNVRDDVNLRRAYLFAIIYLFSPQKFAGFKMSRRLMQILVKKTQMSTSLISHSAENCDFYFMYYKEYENTILEIIDTFI